LAAASVIEDGFAAEPITNCAKPRCDLGDRGVPVDRLEGAVRPPAKWMQDAFAAAVLVVIEPERLLAGIALGGRVGLVASDLLEAASIGPTELHEDAAVALAQDACGRLPLSAASRGRADGLAVGRHRISPTCVNCRRRSPCGILK